MAVGLLGDALAERASKPYAELLHERVLKPLGMTATAVTVPPAWSEKLLDGHSRRGHPRPPIEDFMPAAGSLRSNAEDMLRFLAACLKPPAKPPGPALALAQQPQARLAKRLEIGLCWMIFKRPRQPTVVWHNGGPGAFAASRDSRQGAGAAAVVMSNTARSVDRLGLRLRPDAFQALVPEKCPPITGDVLRFGKQNLRTCRLFSRWS